METPGKNQPTGDFLREILISIAFFFFLFEFALAVGLLKSLRSKLNEDSEFT